MIDEAYEAFGRVQGKMAVSGFAEFDNLTGYVTGNYVSEWTGRDGNRWRTVTTVINLGRPDRGIAVDPDAQQGDEDWGTAASAETQKALADNRRRKDSDARKLFVAYLMVNGPQLLEALRHVTEWRGRTAILEHLRSNPDVYMKLSGNGQIKDKWGLVGVHDKQSAAS
jgi:hypothetical protein